MKKLIALLIVICIIACGCGKEETKNTTTPAPTEEVKTSSTTSNDKENTVEEVEEWVASSRYKRDLEVYDCLISTIQVALIGKGVLETMKDVPTAYFDIDSTGVTVTNVSQELQDELTMIDSDWKQSYMKLDPCRITLVGDGSIVTIKREVEPVNPLSK